MNGARLDQLLGYDDAHVSTVESRALHYRIFERAPWEPNAVIPLRTRAPEFGLTAMPFFASNSFSPLLHRIGAEVAFVIQYARRK